MKKLNVSQMENLQGARWCSENGAIAISSIGIGAGVAGLVGAAAGGPIAWIAAGALAACVFIK